MHFRIPVLLTALFLLADAEPVFPRPGDSFGTPPDPVPGKPLQIAEVWGEQLRPPASCRRAVVNLVEFMTTATNIATELGDRVMLGTAVSMDLPIVFLISDRAFLLNAVEKRNLGNYIFGGGFLVLDTGSGGRVPGQSEASFRKMIDDLFGSGKLRPIPNDHPIYHSWFDFDGPPRGKESGFGEESGSEETSVRQPQSIMDRENGRPFLEGVFLDGRLVAVLSSQGYARNWSEGSVNEPQLKMGVNFIMYAVQRKLKSGAPVR